jgi:hypothetical protein
MRLFDRKSALFLVLLCIPLLFLPKINLIKFDETSTAGLRIDDLVLLLFGCILAWAHLTTRKGLINIEIWLLTFVAFSLFSFISNKLLVSLGILHVNATIFHCVRILEYFLFFYIGILASDFFRSNTIITAFFLWNFMLMVLQKFGIIGEFNSLYGYNAKGDYRVAGIASFPSEMGALLNLIFCYYLFSNTNPFNKLLILPELIRGFFARTYIYWLFLFFAVLVILTGSRIAIIALIVPFLFKLKDQLNTRSAVSWMIAVFFLAGIVVVFFYSISNTEAIALRSKGLISLSNFELGEAVWKAVDIDGNADDVFEKAEYEGGYDQSWWIRIHKWCYALKLYCYHPECYLQGVGPGFTGMALDGGLLRVLVECGLIGVFLFWKIFATIARSSPQLKWSVVAFMLNMIFFDAYLAYKVMSLLFFMTGYAYSNSEANFLIPDTQKNPKVENEPVRLPAN